MQKHLDADHSTIYKRFQEEINNWSKKNVERQFAKKRFLISNSSIFEFFASKRCLQKGWCGIKDVCGKSYIFNNEKSFAFTICGECVVEVFSVIIMSSCAIPFLKIIFKHYFA
jgi:hypothetical protein